jgi:hypothetical protein
VYDDDDPVAQRIGTALVGYQHKSLDSRGMAAAPGLFVVKTHKRPKGDCYPAIYVVRDGRDAVVSQARLRANSRDDRDCAKPRFEKYLREEIMRPWNPDQPSSGSWGGNALSWLNRTNGQTIVVRYENLIAFPQATVANALFAIRPDIVATSDAPIPTFAELQKIDDRFFGRGATGSFRDEMSEELQKLFWEQPSNACAMGCLGYC